MPITIDDTIAGAGSNAYAPITFIDDYAQGTSWAVAWAAKSADEKKALAVRATRAIDTIGFPGYTTTVGQALQWPRFDVYQPSDNMWASDAIPLPLKNAWAHTAAYLSSLVSTVDPFHVDPTAKIKREKIGQLETEYWATTGPDGSTFLSTVIVPMLAPWGLVASRGTVRLVR